jgi:hypothetical protein
MAYSYNDYTGNGSTTQFPVAFGYIRREHVAVTVASSPAAFTWVNDSLIQVTTAPANGAVVRVYRTTPLTAPLVDFADGTTLVAADLDTNSKQSIYTQQELDDSLVGVALGSIPNGNKGDITTSAGSTVWTINNGAVTAGKIASAAFTNSVSSASTTTIATPSSVKTSYDLATTANTTATTANTTATTANTTANAALPKAGGTMTGVITYAAAQPRLVQGTAVATTSGTSVDFTSIPNWVKRLTVMFASVSTSGVSPVQIQIGDSGGIETTGYTGTGVSVAATNSLNIASYTTGAVLIGVLATHVRSGSMVITNVDGNQWQFSSIMTSDDVGYLGWVSAIKTLSATLDRVRLTTVNGTDTFDAGTVNIIYEG